MSSIPGFQGSNTGAGTGALADQQFMLAADCRNARLFIAGYTKSISLIAKPKRLHFSNPFVFIIKPI
jgi:hypothetical protein